MAEDFGGRPSLALGATGTPHVAYSVYSCISMDYGVRYAVRNGEVWSWERVTPQWSGAGCHPSLMVHARGNVEVPLLAFLEYYQGITYGHRLGSWYLEPIAEVGRPGLYSEGGCAIVLSAGRPLIAYHDYTVSGLMLAVGTRITEVPDVPAGSSARPAGAWPRPWSRGGTLSFDLALGEDHGAALEIMDLAGRRIARKDLAGLLAGRHLVSWSPAVPAPGVYFARLMEGTRTVGTLRIVAVD